MATNPAEAFNTFIDRLVPTNANRSAAASHRSSLYSKLNSTYGLYRMFESGSFSHGTGVSGYSDVDYFASLKTDRPVYSSSILNSVRDTLKERYPNTVIQVRRPAVVVNFGSGYETCEIIPAYAQGKVREGEMKFLIPGVTTEWLESTPESHLKYVNSCNTQPGKGYAKSFARLIKAWKCYRDVPISSFYLEMRAAKYISGQTTVVYSYDLAFFLEELNDCGLAAMNDPTGSTGRIEPCSSDAKKTEALSKLQTAATRARNALEAHKKGDNKTAFYYWDQLFNGEFPAYY
ncbi:nucleotidyltransferase [Nocardia sp. 852002-20019_SCH5090214]|uniref:nucleotidyltransferase domain-containing protein n=1 Tax=Nocardia sp. 852002-20019_SCH5090214 TaxID=1834087 RepID=UPI000AFA2E91|nr:nucleotidyltransferase [Nocardia sp. 852002-20019_SCH5090214]